MERQSGGRAAATSVGPRQRVAFSRQRRIETHNIWLALWLCGAGTEFPKREGRARALALLSFSSFASFLTHAPGRDLQKHCHV